MRRSGNRQLAREKGVPQVCHCGVLLLLLLILAAWLAETYGLPRPILFF